MSVAHAAVTSSADSPACAGDRVPGLLEVLAQVPDPRRKRGCRYGLVFVLVGWPRWPPPGGWRTR